ncbi:nucleotidyltransferase domain-containing protein [uncultured Kordia sp.]|uniref:nucleotidyltransferase domain-containing protein n=1 Tax=uncultured Kordia sp. TaxID=507699 RepID=UPI002624E832|nr:nucleotidyltransferase domain-containing protein [uncultured Kordia sp.]
MESSIITEFITANFTTVSVIGVIVSGSFVHGGYNTDSDIDLRIITANSSKLHQKGIQQYKGYMFSFVMYNHRECLKMMEMQFFHHSKFEARMLSTGTLVINNDTENMKRLLTKAKSIMQQPFGNIPSQQHKIIAYTIWNHFNKVIKMDSENTFFTYNYFYFLRNVLSQYSTFLQLEYIVEDKLERYFFDEEYRKKHQIPEFPDTEFVKLFTDCLRDASKNKLQQLFTHVFQKIGAYDMKHFTIEF